LEETEDTCGGDHGGLTQSDEDLRLDDRVTNLKEELQRLKPLGFYALMSWPFEPVTDGLSG
jgi:hypothetical protein